MLAEKQEDGVMLAEKQTLRDLYKLSTARIEDDDLSETKHSTSWSDSVKNYTQTSAPVIG